MVATDKPPLIWAPEAIADLESIWDFYAEAAGLRTAEKMIREIAATCRTVQEHPFIGRARNEVRPGLRSLVSHPNVIFYRVRNDIPQIVRVLDGRRDIDSILFD
jgi:toxin ParE1/3/4